MKEKIKIPAFISEKFLQSSVYNYKMQEDKKLNELFPTNSNLTNMYNIYKKYD